MSKFDVIIIDKNIPLPENQNEGATKLLKSMEIGDSFVAEFTAKEIANLLGIARNINIKLKYRQIEKGSNRRRVWRIAENGE